MKTKKKPLEKIAEALQHKSQVKAQIAARVAKEPVNPNLPKRKHPYKTGTPGFKRAEFGTSLTEIRSRIKEPNVVVTTAIDENGQPTGEEVSTITPASAATRRGRRSFYVSSGLLGPRASNTERKKTRRRNNRYAACNSKGSKPPKKSWHKKKAA